MKAGLEMLATTDGQPEPEVAEKKIARSVPRRSVSRTRKTGPASNAKSGDTADDLRARAEAKLASTADRLKSAIQKSLAASPSVPAPRRKAIQDILAVTVPDAAEISLEER